MPIEYRLFSVSTPAGTALATPQTKDISFPARVVDTIRVRVPPGPRGTLGFYLASGGLQVIPFAGGGFIVADDEIFNFELGDFFDSGAWQLVSYNTDVKAHLVYLLFGLDLPGQAAQPALPFGGVSSLTGGLTPGPTTVPTLPVPVLPPSPVLPVPTLPVPPTLPTPAPVPSPTLPAPSPSTPPSVAPPAPFMPPALRKHLAILTASYRTLTPAPPATSSPPPPAVNPPPPRRITRAMRFTPVLTGYPT